MKRIILSLLIVLGFTQASYARGNSLSLNYAPTTIIGASQPQAYYPQTNYYPVPVQVYQPTGCVVPHLYGTTYILEQGGYVPITDQLGRVIGYTCR